MSLRNIIRMVIAGLGVIQVVAFILGTADAGSLILSGFLFFIAATNFCKECPIIFFARRAYWKMRSRKIPTEKI